MCVVGYCYGRGVGELGDELFSDEWDNLADLTNEEEASLEVRMPFGCEGEVGGVQSCLCLGVGIPPVNEVGL